MAEPLWLAKDAAAATGGTLHGGGGWSARSLSIDTRTLEPGALFVALKGERSDGHAYLAQAAKAGAVAALVDHKVADTAGLPLLIVEDTMVALESLALAARKRSDAKIIAITGSMGKTSAKEALALALSAYGEVHATKGNYNNHIGLPLTLAQLPEEADFAVLEMGMNHAGEIAPLSVMARPDVALVTSVDAVHAEFFESVEDIARAKAEIFAGLGGMAVLPADNRYFPILAEEAERQGAFIARFGRAADAEVRLVEQVSGLSGTRFTFTIEGRTYQAQVRALGAHWAGLCLGVLACVSVLGFDLAPAIASLAAFQEPPGRGRLSEVVVNGKRIALLDDSYNASPVSMRGAIEKLGMLAASPARRTIAVLGQMLELGAEGPAHHLAMAEVLERANITQVFASGALMEPMFRALPPARQGAWAESAEALRAPLEAALQEGDLVLIKGSHGSRVYQIAQGWQEATIQPMKATAHAV